MHSTEVRAQIEFLCVLCASAVTSDFIPLEVLEVPLDVAGALEPLEDQRILQPADDVLHDLRLLPVPLAAADDRVENFDQVQHVLVNLAARRAAEVEEVDELHLEADALAA